MSVVRTVALSGTLQQILPPDGHQHTGLMNWLVVIPAGGATISEANEQGHEASLAAGSYQFPGVGEDALWAKGSGNVVVVGLNCG